MNDRLNIYKKLGETPLEALERTRTEHSIAADVPMTYAGRLDPLVEGQMIILIGEECKNKDAYTKLGKTYEFEILSGVSTDTYDLLGLVTDSDFSKMLDVEEVLNI
jgi:tRNA U55 pseudouridine synthase TruB